MRTTLSVGLLSATLFLSACAGPRTAAVHEEPRQTVVAVVGGTEITLDEFEDRFSRSLGGREAAGEASLDDYRDFLDRYVDFRIKVLAGKDAGLHEIPEVRDEIETYRNNFARPYLLEHEVIEPLAREIHERQRTIIRARHILIRVDENAAPTDTLQAHQRLMSLADSIAAGADFGELAQRYSEDPSAQRPAGQPGSGGDLGYFSTGQMVEPFESQAYNTGVGELSPVFRTSFGYHILYVEDRRENPDPIRVSHIMIDPSAPVEASEGGAATPRELAESVHARALAGEDFSALAREYSSDASSAPRGGDLGFIEYTSRIVPSFIEAAFSIQDIGRISDIVETPFGFHIIKVTDRRVRPDFEEAYPELKQQVSRMPRAQEAERALAARVRTEAGETTSVEAVLPYVETLEPSAAMLYLANDSLDADARQTVVATLGSQEYTVTDLGRHLQNNRQYTSGTTQQRLERAVDDMLAERAIERQARALETTDSEFAALMNEFEDGLILFRFMEDSIWTAAATDSVRIEAIYNQNREQYRFPDRHRVITITTSSDSLMALAVETFDAAGTTEVLQLALDLEGVRADTTFLVDQTNSIYDAALALDAGSRTEPTRDRGRRIVLINDGIDPARTKTLDEARAEVVSAYQEQLEEEVLSRLRDRYGVRLFPERLVEAFDGAHELALDASS